MNIKELKEMINLMIENHLAELELEKQGFKLKLRREVGGTVRTGMEVPVVSITPTSQPAQQTAGGGQSPQGVQESPDTHIIRSPMVGTFYTAPSPDAEAYVSVGKAVDVDATLCIVEAMKLMNEIKSDVKGTVVEVMVENGQSVEFDQPLFKIKKG